MHFLVRESARAAACGLRPSLTTLHAASAMKKRTHKTTSAKPKAAPLPDWLEDPPAASLQPFSKENQAELAANVELGIRGLPVWKDLVQRVGLRKR